MTHLLALVRGLLILLGFAIWYGGSALICWIGLPLYFLFQRDQGIRRAFSRGLVYRAMRAFHAYLRTFRLIRLDASQVPPVLPDGPCVIIANHPTLIDVTAILSLHPDLCCIAKSELFRNPLVGRVIRTCEYIASPRSGPLSSLAVVFEGLERLNRGEKILIFPEGTRSPIGGLNTFHRGAFELAVRAHVPLVCYLIHCDPPTLHPDLPLLSGMWRASRYTVTQFASYQPLTGAGGAKSMTRDLHAEYSSLLQRP